jgi:hypothetical protein
MQGIDWQEMLGIVDVEDLIYQLVAIRDFHGRK